jgi:YfiH family protein
MIRKQRDTIVWYEFELLQPFPYLRHGCFPSLNVTPSHHDYQHTVLENRRLITTALFGTSYGSLIDMHQVHGADVAILSSSASPVGSYDAMATSLSYNALLVKHADCQGCLLFDPEHHVIAAVHCGWRGSVQNIYQATIAQLRKTWGSREESLIACISPSLGPCHAEFIGWEEELPASFEPFRKGNNHFDFWAISRHQLLSCGITPSHIEIAGLCTYCHPELFFSHRRDKTPQRNATCIALVENTVPYTIS